MSPTTRLALSLASLFPAAALAVIPRVPEALASRASPDAVVVGALAVSFAGVGAMLTFVWIAGGLRRPFTERVAWVLALVGFGAVTAPVFWWLHVRAPRPALA